MLDSDKNPRTAHHRTLRTRWIFSLILVMISLQGCGGVSLPAQEVATPTAIKAIPTPTLPPAPAQISVEKLALPAENFSPEWVANQLSRMSMAEKAGQLMVTGVAGDAVAAQDCSQQLAPQPAGFFLMPENVSDPDQMRTFTAGLQSCARQLGTLPLFIAVAHEGQTINRFESGATQFPDALAIAAGGDPQAAYTSSLAAGQELAYAGVNLLLGPVADVLISAENRLFTLRTFGSDAGQVGQYVAQSVLGYKQAGLIPVLKHFPGHGGADAFYATKVLPIDPAGAQDFERSYLPPFWAGLQAGAPVTMIGHAVYPNITASYLPASLSPEMIRLLRSQAGFDGVLVSDVILSTEGITIEGRNVSRAAVEAITAGIDLVIIPQQDEAQNVLAGILEAVESGELSRERLEEAVTRVLRLKSASGLSEFPLKSIAAPDWEAHARLAAEIAQKAVTLYRDERGLVPIPAEYKKILVIGPDAGWSFYSELQNRLSASSFQVELVHFSPPWQGVVEERELLQTLPDKASGYDLVVLITWRAYIDGLGRDGWQMRLGRRLARLETPVIAVAIESPTDLLAYDRMGTYLATMGRSDEAMRALLGILVGDIPAQGVNPLPGLLP